MILERRDPEQRMARAYRLAIQWALRLLPDGSGKPADLIREWSRIGSPGQVRADHFATTAEADAAAAHLAATKQRRGYHRRDEPKPGKSAPPPSAPTTGSMG
jgi:predicted DNA-binding WGR domain protein